MARELSQKLVDYGIVAGIGLAAYLVWTAVFKKEEKVCPAGQHAVDPCTGQIGWPAFLCNLGRNVTGAALDCKPDTPAVVCEPGFNLVNGECQAIGPGGCNVMAETCDRMLPAGSHYLDIPTCSCVAKSYTDECTLGTNDCRDISGVGKRLLECIFVPVLGNRWQFVSPETACGGSALPPPPAPGPSLEDIAFEACQLACGPNDGTLKWANCHLQCEGLPMLPEPAATNIVQCSCGKIDLLNPPGTTCESACRGAPPSFEVPSVPYLECMQDCPTGRDIICWGSEAVCAASGATIPVPDHPGTWTDAAYLVKKACQKRCESG